MTAATTAETTAVTLRDARPADKDFLAWVSLTAARSHLDRGIWEAFLGWDDDRVLDFIGRVLTTPQEHWVHWSQFIVAEVDGAPVAGLCAYDPTTHGFGVYMEAAAAVASELMTPLELEQAWGRGEIISSCMSDEPAGAWIVENVATLPAYRRRGISDMLLEEALERGRARGHRFSQISVFIGNEPARACYVKNGYVHVDEKRNLEFESLVGCPGIERLHRPL